MWFLLGMSFGGGLVYCFMESKMIKAISDKNEAIEHSKSTQTRYIKLKGNCWVSQPRDNLGRFMKR